MLSEIDIHFAKFIMDFSAREDPDIFLAAALVSHATGTGDICFNLETAAYHFLSGTNDFKQPIECPAPDVWREKLKACPAVGRPGEVCPLILDEKNRLYLYRYWNYENSLSESIKKRTHSPVAGLDFRQLKITLDRLFPGSGPQETNWQKIAAAVASLNHFCVITGNY